MKARPGAAAVLLALAWVAAGLGAPEVARGAEYTMETSARYEAMPGEGRVAVAIDVGFTNTTPDPQGQFSVFEEVRLAIHDEAANVAASDDVGQLSVAAAIEEGVNVATVTLRQPLRYEQSATFRLTYDLPDGEGPRLRVRPSLIVFPAWGFGTASVVTVVLPDGYEVSIDGDPLNAQAGDGGVELSSGQIADPSRWLALVTGARATDYTTMATSVALEGGTVDLQVRAFADDAAWGERTLDLLVQALPLLERSMGVPYSRLAPLVVIEAVAIDASGFGEQPPSSQAGEIEIAFDQPPFTALHQVAHVWLGPELVGDRWIAEGIASWASAQAAPDLDVVLPFDPDALATRAEAAAFPLAAWPTASTPEQERYGYAASWALIAEIAEAVGPDAIGRVLARASAGVDPLAPIDETWSPVTPPVPLSTRSLLDHLETTSELELAPRFGELALLPADVELLPSRSEAHAVLRSLLEAAGDWGAPDPVRSSLGAWEFATAIERTNAALGWLDERGRLASVLVEAGLAAPGRLRDAYREHGGGAEAWAELEAERAVAEAYDAALARAGEQRSVVEGIGLLGGPDPNTRLRVAAGLFSDGDLRRATDAIGETQARLDGAGAAGMARVLAVVVICALLVGLAAILIRRRRMTAPSG